MRTRRAMVLAGVAVCALLVSPVPLHGLGAAALVALAVVDAALLAGTGGLAYARARRLDERQAALRDLAYRRGFRLLGLAIVVAVIATVVGAGVLGARSGGLALSQVDSGVSGRLLVTIGELVLMLPTMVVAWSRRGDPARVTLRPALAVPAVAAAWLLAVGWAPIQAAGVARNFDVSASVQGGRCAHFAGGRIVGAGLGATVGMRVEVCWNGDQAFVIGDPGIPLPAGMAADPSDPSLTACGRDNSDDFATVTGTTCTATVDASGTLRYSVRARVSPLPVPFGGRDVSMELVVTRDGRVLSRP